jgi:type I restriction enzyme S subunit
MREGYQKTLLGEIPNAWCIKALEEISNIVTGNTPKTSVKEYFDGNYPWITPSDINSEKDIYKSPRTLTEMGLSKARELPPKTLLVTCIASIGKNAILRVKGSCNQQINAILPSLKHDVGFLYYMMNHSTRRLYNLAGTTAVAIINKSNFSKFTIPFPPLPEQQKIAEILSTVDAKIEIIDQQISETQELKKGLMQQLLTKGIGHTKFKDSVLGKIPKSWEVVKLGDLFKLSSGSGLSKAIAVEGEFQVYGGNGFAYYHNEFTHENSELIIGRVGAKCGCIHRTTEKSWITDNALIIHTRLKDFDDLYLEYVLRKLDLNQFANKNAQPVISGGKIYSIRISLPSLLEQNEISSILSSVDDKLKVLSEKKATYQEMKQGLMQQLLTGKVRV